jgi:exonuclease V gamma subunit
MRLAQEQQHCLLEDGKTTEELGCTANARLVTLEKFLWNALEPPPNTRLLEVSQLSQIIEALLDKTLLRENIYKPLRNYLCHGNSINKIDSLKRVQLSARIAAIFIEYEYNRPSVWSENAAQWGRHGIDAHWLLGKNYFQNFEHEPWQKDLYQKVFNCFSKSEERIAITLPHLYRKKRETCGKEKLLWCNPGAQIILFNVSKISHFHRNTLVEISQMDGVEMHLFLTNPCAEFWEDVDTSRKRTSRVRWSHNSPDETAAIKPVRPEDYDKPDLNLFEDNEDHTLLKLWGSAGKENIYLWWPQAE